MKLVRVLLSFLLDNLCDRMLTIGYQELASWAGLKHFALSMAGNCKRKKRWNEKSAQNFVPSVLAVSIIMRNMDLNPFKGGGQCGLQRTGQKL